MSITDELREWAKRFDRAWFNGEGIITFSTFRPTAEDVSIREIVESIADRIDIARKHAIGYVDDCDPETMAEHGWVRLPVDADGEYIHIGDRMENNERVARIVLTDESWEPSVYLEKIPNVLHEYFCHEISHYHAPTVEDVLREFFSRYVTTKPKEEDDAILTEYAAKLRLAGDSK